MAISVTTLNENQSIGASLSIINSNFTNLKDSVDSLEGVVDTNFEGNRIVLAEVRVASNSVTLNSGGVSLLDNKSVELGSNGVVRVSDSGLVDLPDGRVIINGVNAVADARLELQGTAKIKTNDHIVRKGQDIRNTNIVTLTVNDKPLILLLDNVETVNMPSPTADLLGYEFTIIKIVEVGSPSLVSVNGASTGDIIGGNTTIDGLGATITLRCVQSDSAPTYKWAVVSTKN